MGLLSLPFFEGSGSVFFEFLLGVAPGLDGSVLVPAEAVSDILEKGWSPILETIGEDILASAASGFECS